MLGQIFSRHSKLPQDDPSEEEPSDSETLLADSDSETCNEKQQRRRRSNLCHILIPILCSCLAGGIGFLVGTRFLINPQTYCAPVVSSYSPILHEVDMSLHTQLFNGSFLRENAFRLPAGDEVDAAWESLGVNYRAGAITEAEGLKAGLVHDQVKINQKYGGGFVVNVEGMHQLHCLNLVRQALWYNYDYYHAKGCGAFKNEDHIVQKHVSHCLDIVRQQLMCTVDIGVLGQIWWDTSSPRPFVDFNTKHQCRNFEGVRSWAEKIQLPEDVPEDFLAYIEDGDTVYAEIP